MRVEVRMNKKNGNIRPLFVEKMRISGTFVKLFAYFSKATIFHQTWTEFVEWNSKFLFMFFSQHNLVHSHYISIDCPGICSDLQTYVFFSNQFDWFEALLSASHSICEFRELPSWMNLFFKFECSNYNAVLQIVWFH